MKYKNFLSRLKPEQRKFVLERLGRKEQDFVLMMQRLRQHNPTLFKQIWMSVKRSKIDLSDMFQSVQDVYSCEEGIVEGEVQRTYTVYLKGPKIVGDVSKALVAQADELSQMVKGKRKWTFGHDNRIFTCNLTPAAAKLLSRNRHIEKVVEEKMATIVYGEYAPYPAYSAGVENTDWGVSKVNPTYAWAKNIKGQGVKVCVVDTGIDKNHVDLIHCYKGGYNFITSTDDPVDDHMHGTYCCGIVAGADNNMGYKGIAHECDLYACKVLNSKGSGSFGDIAAAVDWCRVNGMDIVSMSLGGAVQCTGILADAINVAWTAGLVIVAASGNDGPDEDTVTMPGNCGAAIAVGSIDKDEFISGFSSRGPEMEIAAPGEGITAAWLVGHDFYGDMYPDQVGVHIVGTSWYWANGTSAACPHVAGAAALIKCWYPDATNYDIRGYLRDNAKDL